MSHQNRITELLESDNADRYSLASKVADLESANAELLGALREAVEHLDHCCPTDGWGLRDKSADSERHETLVKCRAAIERAEKGAKT